MRNWVEIAVGVYLLGMVLYGHYRGFIRQAVSMFALVATFAIVNLGMPKACTLIKDNTPVVSMIEEGVKNTHCQYNFKCGGLCHDADCGIFADQGIGKLVRHCNQTSHSFWHE